MKSRVLFFVLMLFAVSATAQMPTVVLPNYKFINYKANTLHYDVGSPAMTSFFNKWQRMVESGQGNISIVHIGGSHVQVLKKQKNRETAISYGIGHGGFEVMLILGMTYVSYISLAFMINSGVVGTVIEEARAKAPGSVAQVYTIAEQLAVFSGGDLLIGIVERIFAVMFHIGASILVFYACKDKTKFWLYPLAIVLHTALDGIAALTMVGVLTIPGWTLEIIVALFGSIVFFGAYFLLYKKDTLKEG